MSRKLAFDTALVKIETEGLLNNNCSDFLRSGFLAKSRRAEEQLASGANWTMTNDELAKRTK